jgi:general secretion pathway protein D
VRDGGLIALGGLQELETQERKSQMAIMGSIPILGELFKKEETESIRTELLIFIRPTILRTAEEADKDAEDLINALRQNEDIHGYLEEGVFKEREDTKENTDEKRELPRRYGQ